MSKVKFQQEYIIRTSASVLFDRISTPSGLSEWFCDDVNIKNNTFIFMWDGSGEVAELLSQKPNEYIKFRWEEEDDDKAYFEFRIRIDSMTKEVALIITDFADEDEVEDSQSLWDSQIEELKHVLGA